MIFFSIFFLISFVLELIFPGMISAYIPLSWLLVMYVALWCGGLVSFHVRADERRFELFFLGFAVFFAFLLVRQYDREALPLIFGQFIAIFLLFYAKS